MMLALMTTRRTLLWQLLVLFDNPLGECASYNLACRPLALTLLDLPKYSFVNCTTSSAAPRLAWNLKFSAGRPGVGTKRLPSRPKPIGMYDAHLLLVRAIWSAHAPGRAPHELLLQLDPRPAVSGRSQPDIVRDHLNVPPSSSLGSEQWFQVETRLEDAVRLDEIRQRRVVVGDVRSAQDDLVAARSWDDVGGFRGWS